MKNLIIFFSVFFVSPLPLLAQVYITEILPNTDDDASMEYIDIVNATCEGVDISGYQIADKEKSYTFAGGTTLTSHERYRLGRPTSKIVLNNTSEELSLHDAGGVLVHSLTYATSEKGVAITVQGVTLDTCKSEQAEESTGTGETYTTEQAEDISEEENPETEDISEGEDSEESDYENTGSGDIDNSGTGILEQEEEQGQEQSPESGSSSGATDELSDNTSSGYIDDDDSDTKDIQTSNLLGKSGSLIPQILLYSDSDEDNHIDTLEVLYDVYITGSVDVSKILFYSNTGGLYEDRVNALTGYILDAEIEDNILRLFLEPSHYEKIILTHNATTQSDIRLKSNGGFGITNLSGTLVEDFLLTSSFDAYKEVYEKRVYEYLGTEDSNEKNETDSGTTMVSFPEIVPTIQNYTNTTLSGQTFICRETPCRLNLNFESIFDSAYPSSSYSCRITYNGVVEDKCNPSQWNPTSAGGFEVRIIHKPTGQYKSQYFPIDWNIIANQITTAPSIYDHSPPVPRITLNGTLTKKQIQKNDNHIYCYSNTCALNFDGSDTYDPDGSSMTYSWSSSGKVFSTKKNPTVQEFSIGEHTIEFIVTDSSGKISRNYYSITVLGDLEVSLDMQSQVVLSELSIVSSKTIKQKKQAISFFSPPNLIIEKASAGFSMYNNGYRCVTTNAYCSANFVLTGTTDGIYYKFSYSHDPVPLYSSNPRSRSFQPGRYILTLSAHYEKDGESIWQQSIPIEIVKVKKTKVVKISTPKIETTVIEKSSNKIEIIPTAYAEDGNGGSANHQFLLSILFFSFLLNVFFFRKVSLNNV